MKISQRTLDIMRNFSLINERMTIEPGKHLYVNNGGTVYGWAEVEEEFEHTIGIVKLSSLVAILERIKEPDIEFKKDVAIIKNKGSRIRYKYVHHSLIKSQKFAFVDKKPKEYSEHVGRITKEQMLDLRKMSSILDLEIFTLICESGKLYVKATKKLDVDSDQFEVGLAKGVEHSDFSYSINLSRLAINNESYDLYILHGRGILFKSESNVFYLFGIDADSARFEDGATTQKNIKNTGKVVLERMEDAAAS